MANISTNKRITTCYNKLKYKLVVLVSTLAYINKTYKKYTQKNIFYFFNENLKRNGQPPVKLKTLQNYLYKLEKEFKVTTNYHKHLGVNFGTEIYYQLNFSKKECYQKINKYFQEKKDLRFQNRTARGLKDKFTKNGSVDLKECINNKNNNKKEEKKINEIEKYQIIKYFNKCNFLCKEILSILLDLDIDKDTIIKMLKIIKRTEIKLLKNKNIHFNKSHLKEKQNKLKEILGNTQKQLEKNGYNSEQLETEFKKIYENYKNKPHFIIENHKYSDLSYIKRKLEKSIQIKKENLQKDYQNLKANIFNILIEQLKKEINIEILKPIIKKYLNNQKKIEYNKVFGTYYCELLELIENQKSMLSLKELDRKAI
ncbi:plasmid maintenance protein [Borreliella bissettiae]|uniref:Borrelia PFam57/62 partition protein n=1 Tax=Borrelia bissettiae (strain DSM 17990 / CIP 109136 / DN127) TaxID=521010 RepID=G0ANW7_BORBD|nr:plasmid maintenance protein [Borreliella bissettiae]AEL19393.1 borrelia PFam57/62 partition protein [Borreliella bissettiae DN127]